MTESSVRDIGEIDCFHSKLSRAENYRLFLLMIE